MEYKVLSIRKIPETDITRNAEVREVEVLGEQPQEVLAANRFATALKTQRQALKERGISANTEAFIEADFLIRRSILDKLLDPRHEIDRECGYPASITPFMYYMMFKRDGLSRRVVSLFPDECWQQTPDLFEDEQKGETVFEAAWDEITTRLNIWSILHRADVRSGIGRFGVVLLGLADGKDYAQPAAGIDSRGQKVGDVQNEILYLRVFDETMVRILKREADTSNPRFGKPILYQVTFMDLDIMGGGGGVTTSTQITKVVHWSRLIHFADNRGFSEIFGDPRMEAVFNRLMDVRKILSGSGEMFWKGAFPGISFELQPGIGNADIDTESLRKEMERYSGGLQRYLAVSGLTAKTLAPEIESPKEHLEAQMDQIALALGCPKRVLNGSEEAKLASNQDSKAWRGRVAQRQTMYVTPMVIRPFVDRLIALGILPTPKQYEIYWPDLSNASDSEKATVALTLSQALAQYVAAAGDQLIPAEIYLEVIMGLDPDKVREMMAGARASSALATVTPEGTAKKRPSRRTPKAPSKAQKAGGKGRTAKQIESRPQQGEKA